MTSLIRRFSRRWVALCIVVTTLLAASSAYAYGRVQWSKLRVQEKEQGTQSKWKLELKVFLPSPPDFAHVPVKFEFKPTVYYETFRDDSSPEPQTRRVPTPNAQTIIESVDLGFLDPGTGKIQSRTRFAFDITRAHGFEAGEYRVTIRNARTGAVLGRPVKLVLEGQNEVIDRRAMVFADKKEKEGDEADAEEEEQEDAYATEPAVEDDSHWEDVGQQEDEALPPPEALAPKRGCGCRTAGHETPGGAALGLSLLLGLAVFGRRRFR